MSEPIGRWGAVETIGRGVDAAPVLRSGLAATLALATVGATGRLAIPIVVQQAIDRGFDSGRVDMGMIVALAVIALVATTIGAAAQRTAVKRLGLRAEQALYGLRVRLFDHVHRLSIADHHAERTGSLVARTTSDIDTLAMFFSWGAVAWLLDGTLMLIVAAVMIAYDWMLALVAFVVAAPLVVVLQRVQRRLVRAYDEARRSNADVMGELAQFVAGAETLRAYDASARYAAQVERASHERSNRFIRAGTIGAFLFPSGEVFSVLTVAAVVTVGVLRGPDSGLTVGAMVGFVFLTYRFLEPIAQFTEIIDQTQTAVSGLRRVLGVLELPIGPPEPADAVALPTGRLSIDIDQVTFRYPNRSDDLSDEDDGPVLVDVTARIPAGQHVALVGATGSGKTTLARLVARFADPTAGTIAVGGVPLTRVANAALRQRLVVVPQEPFLFDGSIADNLAFARPATTAADMRAAIGRLGLTDWVDQLAEGLDTPVGPRGTHLSAGERQLVALVRAALADPDVLVLDEATSSVDARTEVQIGRALERLSSGRTTISIAHRLSTAARADRVLVLERGRLVQDGPHTVLVAAPGPYARLHADWVASTAHDAPA